MIYQKLEVFLNWSDFIFISLPDIKLWFSISERDTGFSECLRKARNNRYLGQQVLFSQSVYEFSVYEFSVYEFSDNKFSDNKFSDIEFYLLWAS
jgi:hypothetical protein